MRFVGIFAPGGMWQEVAALPWKADALAGNRLSRKVPGPDIKIYGELPLAHHGRSANLRPYWRCAA